MKVQPDLNSSSASFNSKETLSVSSLASPAQTISQQIEVGFFGLFKFAQSYDILLMCVGTAAAIINGSITSLYFYLSGELNNKFGFTTNQDLQEGAKQILIQYIYVGIGTVFTAWLMMFTWILAGQRQANKCRNQYFKSLLCQQIGWFDANNPNRLTIQFQNNLLDYQGAVGQKIPVLIGATCQILSTIIMSFCFGWQLTLVVCGTFPLLMIFGFFFSKVTQSKNAKLQKNFDNANSMASEAINAIKTIKAFNGEDYQTKRFSDQLESVNKNSIKYSIYSAMGTSTLLFIFFICYAIGYAYSAFLMKNKITAYGSLYTVKTVFIIFYSIFSNTTQVSRLEPCLSKISKGKESLALINEMLDRPLGISKKVHGKIPQILSGNIKFENVTFAYPKEPDRIILRNLNLQFCPMTKNALVGESGCGKSTIMQLLLRYYDPNHGRITLDGIDIKELDLEWLRQSIGYVGQEPILFSTTIRENLLMGKPDATDQELWKALNQANAEDFVASLSKKLDTYVGYGGDQLSGGQKQRIAIARAILKNSLIMLFDEATSALDRQNQLFIQDSLDQMSINRTSITIAHRVKTIETCDKIFVIKQGKVDQSGKFKDLKYFLKHKSKKITALNSRKSSQNEEQKKISEQELGQEQVSLDVDKLIDKYQGSFYSRLLAFNKQDWKWYILGLVAAFLVGGLFPYIGYVTGKFLESCIALQVGLQTDSNINWMTSQWVVLGIWGLISTSLLIGICHIISENQSKHIRLTVFKKMMSMPVSWFNKKQNNPNNLTSILSKECNQANGLTSNYIAAIATNFICTLIGVCLGTYFEWRTTLLSLTIMPFSMLSRYLEFNFTLNMNEDNTALYRSSSNTVSESVNNIKTIYSYNAEEKLKEKYAGFLIQPYKKTVFTSHKTGFLYGLSVFLRYTTQALAMYYGTIMISNYDVAYIHMIYAYNIILCSGHLAGFTTPMIPNVQDNKRAASIIFDLLDQEDQHQIQTRQNSKMLKQLDETIDTQFQLKGVSFHYERRKEQVLEDFDLKIMKGQKVAFAGPSGCGKSTIIQLLMRYYEPTKGQILLNGQNIKDYDIHYLRSLFGVVSQEPILFNQTIRENIIYNMEGTSEQQISNALSNANIQAYANSNMQRKVGSKGSHLSGGQKQRIAIARAILRKPKILLLDQATSALDTENQKIVQECLDRLMKSKTSIAIAHRLDTIVDSDMICLMQKGKIAEKGKYNELIEKKGKFYLFQQGVM